MTESLHLYLNSSTCLLRRRAGWPWKRRVSALGQFDWTADDLASLRLTLPVRGTRRNASLHVVLGAALCKFMIVEVPVQLIDPVERALVGAASMRRHFGLLAGEWECTADIRPAAGQAIVCAVRISLIEHLRALAATHGLRLKSVRPYATVLWDAVCAQRVDGDETGLLAVEDDAFTVIMARAGKVVSVHALQHHDAAGLPERELRRIGLSAGPTMRSAMWLAVSANLACSADIDQDRLLRHPDELSEEFKDLLMSPRVSA
jgi:hypothetical protein